MPEMASPHQRGESLLGGGDNGQFVTFRTSHAQPEPKRSSGFFEFRFEVLHGTEIALDSRFQVAP